LFLLFWLPACKENDKKTLMKPGSACFVIWVEKSLFTSTRPLWRPCAKYADLVDPASPVELFRGGKSISLLLSIFAVLVILCYHRAWFPVRYVSGWFPAILG
jgi:hypothetical protein